MRVISVVEPPPPPPTPELWPVAIESYMSEMDDWSRRYAKTTVESEEHSPI